MNNAFYGILSAFICRIVYVPFLLLSCAPILDCPFLVIQDNRISHMTLIGILGKLARSYHFTGRSDALIGRIIKIK